MRPLYATCRFNAATSENVPSVTPNEAMAYTFLTEYEAETDLPKYEAALERRFEVEAFELGGELRFRLRESDDDGPMVCRSCGHYPCSEYCGADERS